MTDKLNANTTLDKILGYVDSPFKLFAVILMAVIAFAGYALYESQEFIRDAYKESKKLPEIRTERAEDAATMLLSRQAPRLWRSSRSTRCLTLAPCIAPLRKKAETKA
jgi:hypothetical protein